MRFTCRRDGAGRPFWCFGNFKAILKYNNAATYALAVCTLADRYRGGGEIRRLMADVRAPALAPAERMALQTDLKTLGYDPGDIDGVLGRKVRSALRQYQKDHHLPADGYPTVELLSRLSAEIRSHAS